ncbi:MFS transporter [Sphingomonas sp.]|uniref:MFS transporter n=1 Tax=Sphingomonas sp. TaxID=28214 RepID=UPI0017D84A22|nr:MFS transporter [Sphingomonas sp.]MBA4761817.1 MFS transporter [Sphingomonas sp.]
MTGAQGADLRQLLDAAPMSRAQVAAVAVTVLLSALDGFDVLSVTFAAPAIVRDWGISRAALGTLLSAGLVGMALGSFLIAPLADRFGRQRLVLFNLAIMAIGMMASAAAGSMVELAACRVVTGLGIGSMVAVINPLAAEFSNAERRPLAMAMMTVGYPVGGLLGGLLAAVLIALEGWRTIFVAGGVAALVLIPIVLIWLPESPAFLATRADDRSRQRLRVLMRRFGQTEFQDAAPIGSSGSGYRAVFAKGQIWRTLQLALINLCYVLPVYFVLSWLPQMVADMGFSSSAASIASAAANLAGIFGGVTLGYLMRPSRLQSATAGVIASMALSLTAFGFLPASFILIIAVSAICGFLLFGGMAGLYAVLASGFAPAARASGVGFVIGLGRVASAGAPLLAGGLFSAGLGRGPVATAFALFALVSAALLMRLKASSSR